MVDPQNHAVLIAKWSNFGWFGVPPHFRNPQMVQVVVFTCSWVGMVILVNWLWAALKQPTGDMTDMVVAGSFFQKCHEKNVHHVWSPLKWHGQFLIGWNHRPSPELLKSPLQFPLPFPVGWTWANPLIQQTQLPLSQRRPETSVKVTLWPGCGEGPGWRGRDKGHLDSLDFTWMISLFQASSAGDVVNLWCKKGAQGVIPLVVTTWIEIHVPINLLNIQFAYCYSMDWLNEKNARRSPALDG
jgi:hypothetical protein